MKKYSLPVYLTLTILLLANLLGEFFFKYTLAGYWSDRVLFWLWFLATLYIVVVFWKKIWTKIYFVVLVLGLLLSILPMGIPFMAMLLSTTGSGLLYHKQFNGKYRFQVVGYSIMGKPIVEVVENKFLLEKDITGPNPIRQIAINDSTSIESYDINKVDFVSENDSTITLQLYGSDGNARVNFKK